MVLRRPIVLAGSLVAWDWGAEMASGIVTRWEGPCGCRAPERSVRPIRMHAELSLTLQKLSRLQHSTRALLQSTDFQRAGFTEPVAQLHNALAAGKDQLDAQRRRLAMGIASQLTPCCQMNQSTPLIHPPPTDWGSIPNHDSEDPIAWRSGGGCCLKPLHSQTTVVVFTTFAGSSMLLVIVAILFEGSRHVCASMFFGGAVALLRWGLGFGHRRHHCAKAYGFKTFTLMANLLATVALVTGHATCLMHGQETEFGFCDTSNNRDWKAVMYGGFATGFCGSLSTVSTFVTELKSARPTWSYVYGGVSIVLAQALCFIIFSVVHFVNQ